MNKPVYLGLSILDIHKTKMHVCWYDYLKPKNSEKNKAMLQGYRQIDFSCKSG